MSGFGFGFGLGIGGRHRTLPPVADFFNGDDQRGTIICGPTVVPDNFGINQTIPANTLAIPGKSVDGALGPEMVTNGEFTTDTTAWTTSYGATISVNAGKLRVTQTASGGMARTNPTSIPIIIGQSYQVSVDFVAHSAGGMGNVRLGSTGEGIQYGSALNLTATQTITRQFVATNHSLYICLFNVNGASGDWVEWDNVSCKLLHPAALPYTEGGVYKNCVAIGDSLTQGDYTNSWVSPTIDINYWQTIVNKGVSGESLTQMWSRWNADVLALAPTCVVIEGGVNDIYAGQTLAGLQGLVQGMVNSAIANGIKPVIINIPPTGSRVSPAWTTAIQAVTEAYNGWLATWCPANNIPLANIYDTLRDGIALKASYGSGDGIHPNTLGNIAIAQVIAAAMPVQQVPFWPTRGNVRTRSGVITIYDNTFLGPLLQSTAVYTRPTSGKIRPNDFGIWQRVVPETTGQTGTIWSCYTDANNYISIDATDATLTLSRRVGGAAPVTASVNYTHTAGVPFEIQAGLSSTGGLTIRIKQDGGAWQSYGVNADTTASVIAATYSVGSLAGVNQFAGWYAFCAAIMSSEVKGRLEALAIQYP